VSGRFVPGLVLLTFQEAAVRVKSEVMLAVFGKWHVLYSWKMYQGFGRTRIEPAQLHSVVS